MAESPQRSESHGSPEDLSSLQGTPGPEHNEELVTENEGHLDEAGANSSPASGQGGPSADKKHLPAVEGLGRGVKKLMETINNLRTLGVEDIVAPLPKVVVVGDQSAGKSSLIEAISEIKVPRSAGTCTRCPLEINLKTEDVWRCKVSLRQKYIYCPVETSEKNAKQKTTPGRSGSASTQKITSSRTKAQLRSSGQLARSFEHFIAQDGVDYEFKEVDDPEQLEKVLEWAQLATLHPNEDYKNYIPDANGHADPQLTGPCLKFSPNIVRLEITGPRLPNLAFYDLPGIINRAENMHESYLVNTVRDLVTDYIKTPECLVLLAQSMNNEAHLSSAAELVEKVGAMERCIGVLTKADLIEQSGFNDWRKVLDNSAFCLKYGYYVTKQPNQTMLKQRLKHADARAIEKEFFETEDPWASEFAEFSERFGTERLQSELSNLLTLQILKCEPEIQEKVRQKAEEVEAELLQLPDPPANNLPQLLTQKLEAFKVQAQHVLDSSSRQNPFLITWADLGAQFRAAIEGSQPILAGPVVRTKLFKEPAETPTSKMQSGRAAPTTPGTPTPRGNARAEVVCVDISDDDKPAPTPQSGTRKRTAPPGLETPGKKRKVIEQRRDGPFAAIYGMGKKLSVEKIQKHLANCYPYGIPEITDAYAIVQLCQMSVRHWDEPMRIFLEKTLDIIRGELFDRLQDIFYVYKQTDLYTELSTALDGLLQRVLDELRTVATVLYENEFRIQATGYDKAHKVEQNEALAAAREKRREHRLEERARWMLAEFEYKTGKDLTGKERTERLQQERQKAYKLSDKDLGVDDFAIEVEVMARVQSYYNVAVNRFADNVCNTIQSQTFVKIQNELCPVLERHIGLMEPDATERCQRLMIEDPQREIRRAQLKKDKERLNQALECLALLKMPE